MFAYFTEQPVFWIIDYHLAFVPFSVAHTTSINITLIQLILCINYYESMSFDANVLFF